MVIRGSSGVPVRQDQFPDKWSCDSEQKSVIVEVRVPDDTDSTGYRWIEIPTSKVEQWIEKGESAQIQRTARVEFPTEWGNPDVERHNSPRKLIEGYTDGESSPFMLARVFFEKGDETVLSHIGWIGGTGQTAEQNRSKFWVYDFAELLNGVSAGETFTNSTVEQTLELIARLTNDNAPIPISQATIVPPNTEAEYEIIANNYAINDTSVQAGNEGDYNLKGVTTAYYSLSQEQFINELDYPISDEQRDDVVALPFEEGENFASTTILTDASGPIRTAGIRNKSFVANHDTLQDIYNWFENKTGAKLHFEPLPESVQLVADVIPSRRTFADKQVIEYYEGDEDYGAHEQVTVLMNNALYEMKPINSLELRGSTQQGLLDPAVDFIQDTADLVTDVFGDGALQYEAPAEKYPVVEVEVPALVEAADGTKLSPPVVESDSSQLDTAQEEAIKKLTKHLEETAEGEIILNGEPHIMPFDRLDAFEVCDGEVTYEQQPVKYEVESVKHVKDAEGTFKTVLNVSVWANDEEIEVVRAEHVSVDEPLNVIEEGNEAAQ
jgi:hypothetical protein